mmetsp:Transcript_31151/g.98899  ORF Transcript_31151/g.98899 Transcript_31151/m.98899 type:complete len:200 (-) Transcript_31151:2456-3055(-)
MAAPGPRGGAMPLPESLEPAVAAPTIPTIPTPTGEILETATAPAPTVGAVATGTAAAAATAAPSAAEVTVADFVAPPEVLAALPGLVLAEGRVVRRPIEVEHGCTEYKLRLNGLSADRVTHLATQLNWRLNETEAQRATYHLGVADNGTPAGKHCAPRRRAPPPRPPNAQPETRKASPWQSSSSRWRACAASGPSWTRQ